jgi:hypothetical protein
MCGCEDGDQPKVFESVLRKARNMRHANGYRCCECDRCILHGDWYEEAGGLWDTTWDSYRTCLRCVARREAWNAVEGCRPPFEELTEAIIECIREMRDKLLGSDTRPYLLALRKARADLREQVAKLEAQRDERYHLAGVAREERKKALAWCGSGI